MTVEYEQARAAAQERVEDALDAVYMAEGRNWHDDPLPPWRCAEIAVDALLAVPSVPRVRSPLPAPQEDA